MIQRIQTIYLLLSGIAAGVLLLLPLAYQEQAAGTTVKIYISQSIPAMIATAVAAALAFLAIILFKNRPLQMKVNLASLALSMFTFGMLIWNVFISEKDVFQLPNYVAMALPLFGVIFSFLAHKGIKADEKLFRSMDRLR